MDDMEGLSARLRDRRDLLCTDLALGRYSESRDTAVYEHDRTHKACHAWPLLASVMDPGVKACAEGDPPLSDQHTDTIRARRTTRLGLHRLDRCISEGKIWRSVPAAERARV